MANVLVIEDDLETAAQIASELRHHGMTVVHAADGVSGVKEAARAVYDVITLDRLLPGVDGLRVVETLRQSGVDTPVLILSALGELDERVRGLRAGGDDYLVKPFAFAELRARVDALLRRSPERRPTLLRVADLELDLLARTAKRGERLIDLLPREFRLLEYFASHEGQVVTRAMLFEQVWNYRFDPRTNLVDVHVGRLRRKLDGAGEAALLLTVKGEGFIFRAPP